MAGKQLPKFENGQIVVYNDCGLSLHDITKKLNCYHSSWSLSIPCWKYVQAVNDTKGHPTIYQVVINCPHLSNCINCLKIFYVSEKKTAKFIFISSLESLSVTSIFLHLLIYSFSLTYNYIKLKALVLVRSRKLSSIEPDQYLYR